MAPLFPLSNRATDKLSSFTAKAGREPTLDAFIKVVTKDLMTCTPSKGFHNIRTEGKKSPLRELKDNAGLTIKPAGKGGLVVVLNTTDYVAECTKQLSNTTYYPADCAAKGKWESDYDTGIPPDSDDGRESTCMGVGHALPSCLMKRTRQCFP
ncbi:hypothetical protein PoB_002590900 [Plakobranchus ocellatus]|uniref:Uncharacterized protein n=1 Tax=Plakobranchus ocellatus TaxID=259542 RepID=A0AAV3ZVQ6_9GAST|nr:hypothetical protein PoB_002590900 [Plakobranchus ocellatus]